MPGKIFLVDSDDEVRSVISEVEFENEDRLQRAIERQPDLIPGDQIEPDDPRRWLLVKREAGIPDAEAAADRWSVDHLFVDQDGIPTFIECKNSSNPELRRAVVAQMMDYAANGRANWPAGRIKEAAAHTAESLGSDLFTETFGLISPEASHEEWMDETFNTLEHRSSRVDDFWDRVDENLADGRLRLVFAAPTIPRELQTIVDFLNSQMVKTDVVAVEVKLFAGSEVRALVPRVIGRSAYGRAASRSATRSKVSIESLIEGISDPEFRNQIESVIEALGDLGAFVAPGDVGASWRLKLPSREISVGWLFPEGRPGWMGMRDFTLGVAVDYDLLDVGERTALEAFSQALVECDTGGQEFAAKGVTGRHINAMNVGEASATLVEAIRKLKSDLDQIRQE